MTIECLQSVYSIVHDNRMLAERAFYCLRQWDGIVKKYERGENAHEQIYLSERLSSRADKRGALRGYEWKGTCIFKGIPYAHAALPETGTGKALGRSQRCTVLWLCEPAFASGTAGRKWRNDGSAYVLVRKRGLPELKYLDAVHSGWQETSGYGMARTAADFQRGLPSNSSPMTEKI